MHIPDFLNKDDPMIAKMAFSVESYICLYAENKITYSEYANLCEQEILVSRVVEQCDDEIRQTALIEACRVLLSLALAIK